MFWVSLKILMFIVRWWKLLPTAIARHHVVGCPFGLFFYGLRIGRLRSVVFGVGDTALWLVVFLTWQNYLRGVCLGYS